MTKMQRFKDIIRRLPGLDVHVCIWEVYKEISVWGDDYGKKSQFPIRYEYVLQCKVCADITRR